MLETNERQAIQVGCIILPAISPIAGTSRKTLETKNRNCTAPLITWETCEQVNTDPLTSLATSQYNTIYTGESHVISGRFHML